LLVLTGASVKLDKLHLARPVVPDEQIVPSTLLGIGELIPGNRPIGDIRPGQARAFLQPPEAALRHRDQGEDEEVH
jgi:hypothetical protein